MITTTQHGAPACTTSPVNGQAQARPDGLYVQLRQEGRRCGVTIHLRGGDNAALQEAVALAQRLLAAADDMAAVLMRQGGAA